MATCKKPELIIGLVAPVGVNLSEMQEQLSDQLKKFGYKTIQIQLSDLIKELDFLGTKINENSSYQRISTLMTAGDEARKKTNRGDIVSLLGVSAINFKRGRDEPNPEHAYILRSLKHPAEVSRLRKIYGAGFILLGFSSSRRNKLEYLNRKGIKEDRAINLIERDEFESLEYGQRTRDVFHLSDAFVDCDSDDITKQISRIFNLFFGNPYVTPSRDEYAMFLAFAASLRSCDLSRQVGAVIMSENGEIISTGTNEVPKFGGGLYWYDDKDIDRDYERGHDSNAKMRNEIIDEIIESLGLEPELIDDYRRVISETNIYDITEFGRSVHAEMEALMSCVRVGVSARNATLYSTTFPCHNCAKHIISAGIKRVVYIEPYVKSKAPILHNDSIILLHESDDSDNGDKVIFEPFNGIGPRRYTDLFSMNLSDGDKLKRKNEYGNIIEWNKKESKVRMPMLPTSYIEREDNSVADLVEIKENIND